jgi:plasmid stability protein
MMSDLVLTDVPDELSERLKQLADGHHSTVAQEAVRLIRQAIEGEDARARHAALLEELRRNRVCLPPGTPDSVELLQEDRAR